MEGGRARRILPEPRDLRWSPPHREREIIFAEVFGRGRTPFGAVSVSLTSPVLRCVATVIAWLQPGFKAFPPDVALDALEHVGLAAHVDRMLTEFEALQAELTPVRTLALLRSALAKARGTRRRSRVEPPGESSSGRNDLAVNTASERSRPRPEAPQGFVRRRPNPRSRRGARCNAGKRARSSRRRQRTFGTAK